MTALSVDRLKELFELDKDSGKLFWKVDRTSKVRAGDEVGSITSSGYIRTYIDGKRCMAHRIVWALHTGEWPKAQVDHINGNGLDNRPCNLREASVNLNAKNRRVSCNNTSGVKGVSWVPRLNKWKAEITVDKERIYLGVFFDKVEAASAYREASVKYFGEFRRVDE